MDETSAWIEIIFHKETVHTTLFGRITQENKDPRDRHDIFKESDLLPYWPEGLIHYKKCIDDVREWISVHSNYVPKQYELPF